MGQRRATRVTDQVDARMERDQRAAIDAQLDLMPGKPGGE
jgi:hypothetical protein